MFATEATRKVKSAVKDSLSRLGVEIRLTHHHDWTDTANFIPLQETLNAARRAGLSVGDYIDSVMNHIPGATQQTIDALRALGVFAADPRTILEIGPGSGRYLEKTLAVCHPARYEIYETAVPWAQYLETTYHVVRQPTDGRTLAATAAQSVDLVQAHKVFSSINMLQTLTYWREMVRVLRSGGYAVFDIATERCLSPEAIRRWIESGVQTGAYPAAFPHESTIGYFTSCGFSLVGSFLVPMGPGSTEVFAFRKD